jgi:hypothetical protein
MKTSYIENAMANGARMTVFPNGACFYAVVDWPRMAMKVNGGIETSIEDAIESLDRSICDDWAKEMIDKGDA